MKYLKTLELLRKQKSLYCLLEIMRLHILVGLKEKRDMSKEQEDIKILQSFLKNLAIKLKVRYMCRRQMKLCWSMGTIFSTERKSKLHTVKKSVMESVVWKVIQGLKWS